MSNVQWVSCSDEPSSRDGKQTLALRRVIVRLKCARWTKKQIQICANVALCQLDV